MIRRISILDMIVPPAAILFLLARLWWRGWLQVGDPIGMAGKYKAATFDVWIFNIGYVLFIAFWAYLAVDRIRRAMKIEASLERLVRLSRARKGTVAWMHGEALCQASLFVGRRGTTCRDRRSVIRAEPGFSRGFVTCSWGYRAMSRNGGYRAGGGNR